MKKRTSTSQSNKKNEESLSPWQEKNMIFLEKDEEHEEQETTAVDTTVENNSELFKHRPDTSQDDTIHRYVKLSDIDEDKPSITEIFKQETEALKHHHKTELFDEINEDDENNEYELPEDDDVDSDDNVSEAISSTEQENDKKQWHHYMEWFLRLSKRAKAKIIILGSVLFISVLVAIYSVSPLSYISGVSVTGNQMMATTDIKHTADIHSGERLWQTYRRRHDVIDKIKRTYPGVQSVHISIHRWNHITINVKEYKPVGWLIKDKISYYPILSNGTILTQKVSENKPERLLFTGFQKRAWLKEVIDSYNTLPQDVKDKVKQISYEPSKVDDLLVRVYMKDGNQVLIQGDHMDRLKYYNQISKKMKEKGIVDMEAGIYAYPYGNNDSRKISMPTAVSQNSNAAQSQEIVIPTN